MTVWTDEQWAVFCACIAEWWPGEFTDGARSAWRIALDAVDPATAMLTAKQLLHSGERFRPSCSSFLFAVRRDPSRPTFDEAYQFIYRAAASQEVRTDTPLLVRAFIERQGLQRLGRLPLDDPDWGEKTRRDLKDAWDTHVEAFDGREIAAIASGSSDLRQLDPLTTLRLGT